MTPLGQIEGLLLDGDIQVHFPAAMGERVALQIRRGDVIGVTGRIVPDGSIDALRIVRPDGRQIARRVPALGPRPVQDGVLPLNSLEARGVVELLLHGPGGEVTGVLLSDGTVVHLPAHLLRMMEPPLAPGMQLSISGYGLQTTRGRAIEATAIAAD
ncbi:MAG TPA: hypothetical protein VM074_09970 [Solimonas sp.]|nr:hypothetical protein [Solimonas sp.]